MNPKTSETPSVAPSIPATVVPKDGPPPAKPAPVQPDPQKLAAALGGPPLPMRITTGGPGPVPREKAAPVNQQIVMPDATPAAPAAPVPQLSPTFAPPAASVALRQNVAALRAPLLRIIAEIQSAERMAPELIEAIRPEAAAALSAEHFNLKQAEEFLAAVSAAVAKVLIQPS